MGLRIKTWLFVVPVALFFAPPSFAQTVPDQAQSGVIEKSLDKKAPPPSTSAQRQQILQHLEFPDTGMQMDEGKALDVKSFNITGNTIFKTKKLSPLVAKYAKSGAHFKDLLLACEAINAFYRQKGYFLTRAILPAQEIKDGVVTIQVIEGRLGQVIVQGGKFYKPEFIQKYLSNVRKGGFNYNDLTRMLILLNEYPDLDVKATLQKGKEPLTTDVVVTVTDKRPIHAFVDYNNAGSRYVSRNRVGTGFEYSNLISQGDKVTFREISGTPIHNQGYVSATYERPINSYGTKANLTYTWSDFDVQGVYRRLNAGGQSETFNLGLVHPVKRTLTSSMDAIVSFDHKDTRNYLLGRISNKDRLRILNAGISGDFLEKTMQGRDYYKVMFSQGIPDTMHGDPKNNILSSRSGAGSWFLKNNIEVGRYQRLPWEMMLLTKAQGQMASEVLPASEQFIIGGVDTVRGFPTAEHMGDTGAVLNAELTLPPFFGQHKVPFLKKTVKEFMQLVAFIDYGVAQIKNASAGQSKDYEIAGAGFATRFDFGHDLNVKVDVGFPITQDKPSTNDDVTAYVQVIKKF